MNPAEQPLTIENLARWVNRDWKWMPRKGSWFQKLAYRLAKDLLDAKLKLAMYEESEVSESDTKWQKSVKR